MQTNLYTQEFWRLRAWMTYCEDSIRKLEDKIQEQNTKIEELEQMINSLKEEFNLLKLSEWQTKKKK